MARISTSTTVGALVADRSSRVQLFDELGVDYFCGGKQELAEACAERGLDAELVLTLLRAEFAANEDAGHDWSQASTAGLCDHIVTVHHGYLHRELPHLETLWQNAERLHGARDPIVREVRKTFGRLRAELERHVQDEERTVFPCLRELDSGGPDESLADAVAVLEHEHALHGLLLARLRELTDDYDSSQSLCDTHRWAIDGLRELQRDLREHMHEENNLLFARLPA